MAFVIDTSALIQAERDPASGGALRRKAADASIYVPAIVWAELFCGVYLADTVERALARRSRIERLRQATVTLDFTDRVAETWARLFANLQKQGTPIPSNDLQVAATALVHGHPVLVGPADESHFRRIPGLEVRSLS